jgi:deoxyribodipyrimidine photo-lyase
VLKDDGTPYKVFTPYARAWYGALQQEWFEERVVNDAGRYNTAPSPIPTLDLEQGAAHLLKQFGYDYNPLTEWPVGDGQKRLGYFEKSILDGYKTSRDFVGVDGTSRLSPYLRFGLVSIRECYRIAAKYLPSSLPNHKDLGPEPPNSARKWIAELIWREFYAMILYRFPESVNLEFQPQTRGLNWENNPAHIAAWKEGRTGFPIVDAAMRQLKITGWMHNRARMIVASFMTKDLLTDWRIGEEHFAQYLMDYELSSNVGGWQWAASTGTDAQPYFRVFNPYLQSKRFDPEGAYIKKYVPELQHLNAAEIHEPSPLLAPNYPQPIVNHAAVKEKAIALFKR